MESKEESSNPPSIDSSVRSIVCNAAAGLSSNLLLMMCRILVDAPDGSSIEAQAVLDSASSASFVSERLVQTLCLTHNSPLQSIASLRISALRYLSKKYIVTAVVVPRVTCDLPLNPIPFNIRWKHLEDITLSDPQFGRPRRINLLLGVHVFVVVLMHGWWTGLPGAPIAFETLFGCVLAGKTDANISDYNIVSHHVSFITGDDLLPKF